MSCELSRILTAFSTCLTVAVLLPGCGDADRNRVSVSGTVTLDGHPLEDGSILFIPKGNGPTIGGNLQAGHFRIPRNQGPVPGKYRAEIRSFQGTGEMVPDDDIIGQMKELQEQIVPPRYNEESELESTFVADKTDCELTFPLISD